MMIAAPHLPKNLWPYATKYTAKLMNHYPSTALPDGKTPRQLLLEFLKTPNPVPSVYGIRKFGQPRWAHIPEQRRVTGDKFSPRARKAYMVGRDSSRIFYMWDPETNKVSRTSSVAWAKHGLIEAPSAKAPPTTSDTAFQITIPISTIESSPPRLPEQASMQHELLQPYLGGGRSQQGESLTGAWLRSQLRRLRRAAWRRRGVRL
jgi:hypothetical protein